MKYEVRKLIVQSTRYQVPSRDSQKGWNSTLKRRIVLSMDSYTNGSYGDTWYMACLPPLDLQNSIILRTAIVINNEGGLGGD